MYYLKNLYIFFWILSLFLFFFSTTKVHSKAFEITNIEISKPFEKDFNKNQVLDEGFNKAFFTYSEPILAVEANPDLGYPPSIISVACRLNYVCLLIACLLAGKYSVSLLFKALEGSEQLVPGIPSRYFCW